MQHPSDAFRVPRSGPECTPVAGSWVRHSYLAFMPILEHSDIYDACRIEIQNNFDC